MTLTLTTRPLYKAMANKLQAIENCQASGNWEWEDRHSETLEALCKNLMPSGSGFDSGTELDLDRSTPERLVFTTSYHHMNPDGFYDGWTYHTVTIRPSLVYGFTIKVGGRDRNDIKDYIAETFSHVLSQEIAA